MGQITPKHDRMGELGYSGEIVYMGLYHWGNRATIAVGSVHSHEGQSDHFGYNLPCRILDLP